MTLAVRLGAAAPLAGGIAVIALLISASGGGKQAGVANLGTTTTTANAVAAPGLGSASPPERLLGDLVNFSACMRSHGVPQFPDVSASSGVVKLVLPVSIANTPQFKAAQRACRALAPPKLAPPVITPQDLADFLKAALCLRSHGITGFPDPVFSTGQVRFPLPPGMDANSTPFRRAREICEMLIPPGLPYSKQAEGGQ